MSQTIVFGAGMVGAVMALDLVQDADRTVCLVDVNEDRLAEIAKQDARLKVLRCDLSRSSDIIELADEADLVLGAMPSRLGLETLRAVVSTGTPYCDITFTPEDAWSLDSLAHERGSVAVVDCGVAPGMTNLLAGLAARRLDPCRSIEMRVGGLPKYPQLPWLYKAGFSPFDVIEEYLRPARMIQDGQLVTREALSGSVMLEFPEVGTLEAFNTDGLRSLTETLDVPNMVEQTLRYPGHRDLVWAMRETGLFSNEPLQVGDGVVTPREVTCAALFPKWTYEPGEVDITVLRVEARGDVDGVPTTMTWELYDELDPKTGWTSMARTTAFPATIIARLIERGVISEPGVYAPERLADNDDVIETLFTELQNRGVIYRETVG